MTDGDIAFARYYTGVRAAWVATTPIRLNRYNTRAFLQAAQNCFRTKYFVAYIQTNYRTTATSSEEEMLHSITENNLSNRWVCGLCQSSGILNV
jgi:hypothetical protein